MATKKDEKPHRAPDLLFEPDADDAAIVAATLTMVAEAEKAETAEKPPPKKKK